MLDTLPLKALRDQPFDLLAELERRGRAVSAQVADDSPATREWVGIALRMAGETYLVARDETREVLSVPPTLTRVPGARPWLRGIANVRGQILRSTRKSSQVRLSFLSIARPTGAAVILLLSESGKFS